MYTWQMNDGRWQVDAYTNAPAAMHRIAFGAPSFDTRAEADAWRAEAMRKAAVECSFYRANRLA